MRTLEPDGLTKGTRDLPSGDNRIVKPEAAFVALKAPVARARHMEQVSEALFTETQFNPLLFEFLGQAQFVVEVHGPSMAERVVQLWTKLPV